MDLKDLFPEWYAVVDPGFTSERIAKRLASISNIAKWIALTHLVELVYMFYGIPGNSDFVAKVRSGLREIDDTYVSHDSAELAVIAAGVLYLTLATAGPKANAAALLILAGEYGGLRGTKRIDAVVIRARNYLLEEGTRVREQALRFPQMTELLKQASSKLQTAKKGNGAGGQESDPDPNLEIHADMIAALKSYGAGLTEALGTLEKRRLEESGVLYWLVGGRTLVSEEPFGEVDKPRLALLAAHDLANQTQHLPGPASSRSILRSVIARGKGNGQQSSTKSCIGKITAEEGTALLVKARAQTPLFMPLTFALEKNRENGWAGGWETAFSSQTKMNVNSTRHLDEIAEQYYREILLARLLGGVGAS